MVPATLSPTPNTAPNPWIDRIERVPLLVVVELVDAGGAVDIPFPPELVDVTVTNGVVEVDAGAELSELGVTLVAGGMIVLELVELLLGAAVDEVVVEG